MPKSFKKISVIVPQNPFVLGEYADRKHCLCVLDVEELMEWWPGTPHSPHRDPDKVKAIQRSLEWKRVAQIAAYLLQREILDVPQKLDKYFSEFYEPERNQPGREWPPRITTLVGYEPSEYRAFSNVLVHVNGAELKELKKVDGEPGAGELIFDRNDKNLSFSVIDGQHRINGAYLAIKLQQEVQPHAKLELPAEVFLDLDEPGKPKLQAQIFIDVNFYQKKVDRSLVADLFPTARGGRGPLNNKERAQDIGRKLMLDTGPLVGMIQIPGIRYGYKDVITLATLNGAIEDLLNILAQNDLESLDEQTDFIAQCLTAWLEASGRFEKPNRSGKKGLDSENVAYQGRVLVSVLTLIPALIWKLKSKDIKLLSTEAAEVSVALLKDIAKTAGLVQKGVFIDKSKFRARGFLGSGGIARFRDLLWAAVGQAKLKGLKDDRIAKIAEATRAKINKDLLNKLVEK